MAILTRRSFLGAAALPLLGAAGSAKGNPGQGSEPRIVALEWRYGDHTRSLGLVPVGIADLADYARQASADAETLSKVGTIDVGRRQEPSIEAIIAARPTLILGVGFRHERIRAQLDGIAETVLFDYTRTGTGDPDQLALMLSELVDLGMRLGKAEQASASIAGFDEGIDRMAGEIAKKGLAGAPVIFAQFPSGVNAIRLFTDASLPGRLLQRLGLAPAWHGQSEGFGFTTVGPERLLTLGEAHLVGVAVGRDNSYTRLATNPLWDAMPFVRGKRFQVMTDVVWPFGGLPAALSFAGTVGGMIGG